MNFLKNHWIRLLYTLMSGLLILIATHYKQQIINDISSFNEFSYIGVVATIIALLVAVFEIIHSINISKDIREEARSLLMQAQNVNGASFVSECLSVLDEANEHVSGERYSLSLKCFQHFRRTYLRISGPKDILVQIDGALGGIELGLQQATHTSASAPLTKGKRMQIQKDILNIKECLENIDPAKRGEYVPSQN